MLKSKRYNTMPLGDIMKAVERRKNSFKRRAQQCSNPRIPALPSTTESKDKLPAVQESKP